MLAGAAIVSAALALWPWLAPIAPSGGVAEPATPPPSLPPILVELPPPARFAALFERPLFSPSRRPPREEKAPVAESNLGARYRLLGLVTIGETRRALVAEGARRFEVIEGATLDGWTVLRIESDRVLFATPSGSTELKLQRTAGEEKKAAGPPPAAPAVSDAGREIRPSR